MGRQIPTECIHGVILDPGDFDAQVGKCQICDGEPLVMDDRIKLAKAMKLEIYSRGADTYPLRKLHNNLMQPFTPFTDANDDYAVLEWVRKQQGEFLVAFRTTLEGCGSSGGYALDYKIGDYARAAVLVSEEQTRGFDIYSCGCKYPGIATDRTFELPCPNCYGGVRD